MDKGKERITIGVLVGGIMDYFTIGICRGVAQMARTFDVDVVVLPGKYVNRDMSGDKELTYEYQFNTIFQYAKIPQIQGIIVAEGSIGCFSNEEAMREMLSQYEGIPSVLIASRQEGYTTVNFDNRIGIHEGLRYLIEQANCKKIGMIGGPLSNSDARERKEVFQETLAEYGLPFEEKQYVNGNYERRCYQQAGKLLDDNPDLDGIFCVNDDTALGLYEEMKRRGLVPGRDISVLGFDDTRLAARATPPLSSVKADPMELGNVALKMLLNKIEGRSVCNMELPTHFVRRGSIAQGRQEIVTEEAGKASELVDAYFGDIYYRYRDGEQADVIYRLKDSFTRLVDLLEEAAEGEELLSNQVFRIEMAVDEYIASGAITYADMGVLIPNFQKIFHDVESSVSKIEKRCELKQLFANIYCKMLQAMDNRWGADMEYKIKEDHQTKLFVRETLLFEKGNDLSYTMMIGRLQWLGVRNAMVYIFPEIISHLARESFEIPEHLYLKAYLKDGVVISIPKLRQKVSRNMLFRNSVVDPDRRFFEVMLPLYSNENLYGVVIMDLTDKVFENGEFLVNQMSSAAKMIDLLKTNEKVQQKLEESLAVLKENNIALDNLSRIDAMTGILNRRGFMDAAQKMINEKKGTVYVIYVDMNNLKIINDRYGHEEGDYSLKLIADVLWKTVEGRGIAGRIGGDEFACALIYEKEDEGESVLQEIYHQFYLHNQSSDKPYNVTVSAGACKVDEESGLTLQHALTQADERLYRVKMLRSKDVAKE